MILETQRLLLREMTLSDLDALLLVLGDAESMRYYPKPFDRESSLRNREVQ
ncbi:GNAT family N-acetyltransferase [Nostoc sp.]|uniref:GNAT family N-acetyltransferase n=1 Tax=Nostoc sp. TaxID=1180 RepID=UPI002FFA1ABE